MKTILLGIALLATTLLPAQKMVLIPGNAPAPPFNKESVQIAEEIIEEPFNEWIAGATYYGVDFESKLKGLRAIKFVDAERAFSGEIMPDGVMLLNSLYRSYPSLTRIKIYQMLAQFLGAEKVDKGREIMSTVWQEINIDNEGFAQRHRHRSNGQEARYFEALAKQFPLYK